MHWFNFPIISVMIWSGLRIYWSFDVSCVPGEFGDNTQMFLAWELNGDPPTSLHGAPLRLASPLKYGIKLIKRISSIEFSNERGRDYWTERGYDWYAGL